MPVVPTPCSPTVSSVAPQKHVLQGVMCIACLACIIGLFIFTLCCLLLSVTHVQEVHEACPGLWDFVLISMLSPFILWLLYLFTTSWSCLSPAAFGFLTVLGTLISVQSSLLPICVETLRVITPPVPWLLFLAWLKTIMFMTSMLSSCSKAYRNMLESRK